MKKTKNLQHRLQLISLTLAATLLVACGGGETTNNYITEDTGGGTITTTDADGDGLSDAEEALIGTSARLKDTDGDGFDDFKEVVDFGFNSDNNNFRFNPLIADVPKIRVEITSVPNVSMSYTTTTGATKEFFVERSTESANTVTTSDTSSNSRAVEETHSVGVEASVSVEAGPTGGVTGSASVSYDYSHATTNESSFSHTEEQSTENREVLSKGEAYGQSNDYETSGGVLSVAIKVTNDSDLAFRLDSLVLGSVMVDSLNRGGTQPVANLEFDTQFSSFSKITLPPNSKTGDLIFLNDGLDIETTKTLLRDANSIIVNVAASEVVDANGVAFAFRQTDISAKTATVIIDYGRADRPSERYLVATNVNSDTGRVPMVGAMSDILKIPYTVNTDGSLDSVRGLKADSVLSSYWVAVHLSNNGLEAPLETLNPENSAYDFNARELKAGDVLQLTYMEDADEDGLGLREEFFAGTDPTKKDTDGDKLLDGDELNGFELTVDYGDGEGPVILKNIKSNPTKADTDNDGITDLVELSGGTGPWITDPRTNNTDGDLLLDVFDPTPTVFTKINLEAELVVAENAAGATTGSYTLGGNTPTFVLNSPIISSATTVEYLFYRERVAIADSFCADDSCYQLANLTSAFGTTQSSLSTTGWILQDNGYGFPDYKYRYQIYIRVNGSEPILLNESSIDTAVATQSLTVTVQKINVPKCLDRWLYADTGSFLDIGDRNLICELFWSININGVNYDGKGDAVGRLEEGFEEVQELGLIQINKSVDIKVPTASCFSVIFSPWEHEGTDKTNTVGDDKLSPQTREHCPDNNWNIGAEQKLPPAIHKRTGSYGIAEEIHAELIYTITETPVIP